MSDTEQLKDFPIRTVIKVLRTEDIKIGTILVCGGYLYKRTDEPPNAQCRPWSGIGKDNSFSESFGFYLESIQNSYNLRDIEILYPKQEIEDYIPQVGDVFMWISDDDTAGKLFSVTGINSNDTRVELEDHEGEYNSTNITTPRELLKNGSVCLVDGPCMGLLNQWVPEVSTPKNNDGRSNCYACGGGLKDWQGFIEVHQVCVDCGK